MVHYNPNLPTGQSNEGLDLSQIFIGRQQQLDLFEIYLRRWKQLILDFISDETPANTAPTPDNKIEGLVVLLFGRGGFGKSTLLKHYRAISLQDGWNLKTSKIVDWEFAVEGKRSLFNPPQGQPLDTAEYFKVLCGKLAFALDKETKDFKAYQSTVKDVEKAKKEASYVLDTMQKDDRYGWLRGLTIEIITSAVSIYVPGTKAVVEKKQVQDAASVVGKLTQEQIAQVYARLNTKLGNKLVDYLEPSLRLGLALGSDLRDMARNYPLLIFFDTYEEVDEGDRLLRMIMGAAGIRVGWVIAGRDNLWEGSEQRERSVDVEYGYKEIVPSDRGLSINFNAGDVGAFTISDITEYFALLCKKVPFQPPLPVVTEEQAKRILDVTQGVPLAVKIAAGLYLERANLEPVTELVEDKKRTIVDQMVRRYLVHTHTNMEERTRLYGLALLRRADQPTAIAASLGLTQEQARISYRSELSRLQRSYSFIFTEKELPALHQEVRYFLRLWLLEHRRDPEIVAVNKRLYAAHEEALKQLEEQMAYTSLRERLQDEDWVGMYLDLTEQQFWLDPAKGVNYSIPFMIAAAIYRKDINEDVVIIGKFFESQIRRPYNDWWNWGTESLTRDSFRFLHTANILKSTSKEQIKAETSGFIIILMLLILLLRSKLVNKPKTPTTLEIQNSDEMLIGLEKLEELVEKRGTGFPTPLPNYHDELAAALWWRLGEYYEDRDAYKAYEWYEKALTRLYHVDELREAAAETCVNMAYTLDGQDRHTECIRFLNRAIELKPDYAMAYTFRGTVYNSLEEYLLAIGDYNQAISLDSKDAEAYKSRGETYFNLEELQRSIEDYNRALDLTPEDPTTYHSRGVAYDHLRQYDRAIINYDRAIGLDPLYTVAYNDRGNAYACLKDYERAVHDYDRAIELDQSYADAYSNRGMAHLWLKNLSQSADDYSRSSEYNPADIDSAWMAEWVRMGRHRAGTETAERLGQIAAMQPGDYIAYICRGVAFGLHGNIKDGLGEVDKAIVLGQEECDAYFWKGMLLAYYRGQSHAEEAVTMIQQSLEAGLPPILLTPLYWLEKDRPSLFVKYASPLLLQYNI
jgi:tetratricopeptide (TPR) repeat protein